jgi:hypothetical protein
MADPYDRFEEQERVNFKINNHFKKERIEHRSKFLH